MYTSAWINVFNSIILKKKSPSTCALQNKDKISRERIKAGTKLTADQNFKISH